LNLRRSEQTPFGLLSAHDAVRLRRLLFLLVDAGRSLGGSWAFDEDGPDGIDLALGVMDASIDSAARVAADAFVLRMAQWQEDIVRFRCGLSPDEVRRLRGSTEGWDCRDIRFDADIVSISLIEGELGDRVRAIPTRLTLTAEQVDAAIEAGRQEAPAHPRLRALAAP
jgi:NTE family protein